MLESFGARRINLDGSRNIFCNRCHEFICTLSTMENFNSALCVICQAADRDEVLPPDVIKQLRSRKIGDTYIPLIFVEGDKHQDPMVGEQALSGRVEFYIRVISRKAKEAIQEIRTKSKVSVALAKEKRKPRIFDRPIDDE